MQDVWVAKIKDLNAPDLPKIGDILELADGQFVRVRAIIPELMELVGDVLENYVPLSPDSFLPFDDLRTVPTIKYGHVDIHREIFIASF